MERGKPLLTVSNIHKAHEGLPTLKGVDLMLQHGEILCLLGPSGCGKTTLLRIISGLEKQDQGKIIFDGNDLDSVPPYKRKFSMMFQEFALFPHKNVTENIAFGLKIQSLPADEIRNRTAEMIQLVGLEGKEKRDIGDLSGGERQRVALARSLAPNPRLLMLDEPMGSLDRALRERLTLDLRQILKKVHVTTLFVTHDQNEAFVLADRVAVFNKGFVEQEGTPEQLFRQPENEFVARFMGFQNLIPAKNSGNGLLQTQLGDVNLPESLIKQVKEGLLLIRPEAARVISGDADVGSNEILVRGNVIDSRFQGSVYQVQMSVENNLNLLFNLPWESEIPQNGQQITLALNPSAMTFIRQ